LYCGKFVDNEDKFFKEVFSMFPEEMANKTAIEQLIFMEHYRFPTRLLDITPNPLVALFFACFQDRDENSINKDAIVSIYSVSEDEVKYCDSDSVVILANIAKMNKNFSIKNIFHLYKKEFNNEHPIPDVLTRKRQDIPGFFPLIDKNTFSKVIPLRAKMNNPRIIRQDGYFFLFGINKDKQKQAEIKSEWILEPIIIPSEAKEKILKELKILNMTETFVYPEYENFNNFIREKYEK
jgi:hypothetical protein